VTVVYIGVEMIDLTFVLQSYKGRCYGNLFIFWLIAKINIPAHIYYLRWHSTGTVSLYHPRSKCHEHEDVTNLPQGNQAC